MQRPKGKGELYVYLLLMAGKLWFWYLFITWSLDLGAVNAANIKEVYCLSLMHSESVFLVYFLEKLLANMGLEPMTFSLLDWRSNQLS